LAIKRGGHGGSCGSHGGLMQQWLGAEIGGAASRGGRRLPRAGQLGRAMERRPGGGMGRRAGRGKRRPGGGVGREAE
jgi:hypothetical protein